MGNEFLCNMQLELANCMADCASTYEQQVPKLERDLMQNPAKEFAVMMGGLGGYGGRGILFCLALVMHSSESV